MTDGLPAAHARNYDQILCSHPVVLTATVALLLILTVFELSLLLGPESPPLLLPPVPQKAVLVAVLSLSLGDVVVRSVVDLVRVGLELL